MASSSEQQLQALELIEVLASDLSEGQAIRHVRFSGTSMMPMLRQGIDCVEFSPVPPVLKKYDLPLYQRENGQYILHRIVDAGETYTCIGDNQFVLEPDLHHSQMLALVTAFSRGDKWYSVDCWHYRLYCRFWHYSRPIRHFWRRGIGWLRRHLKK